MSYVLGWKTRSNVYIAADSMITGAATSINDHSSFGERQIVDGSDSVAERALKIVVNDDLAIGLCGDFRLARDLASSVFRAYRRLRDPEAALREMIVSNGPFPIQHTAQLVVAWRGEPCPRLFSFNHDGSGTFQELGHGEGVPLGSVRAMHKSMTQELLKRLFAVERQGSAAYLAAALGALQSLGVHDYLLDDGVGGSFTGLSVSRETIAWQPDLLYLIDEPGKEIWPGVATCVRDQNLIVTSTITNQPRVFMTTVEGANDPEQWSEMWSEFARAYITRGLFDFVVLLGLERWVVVVIEMKQHSESKMLRFHADSIGSDGVSWFELHSEMRDALRRRFASDPDPEARDFRFGFEPFQAPGRAESEPPEETPRFRGAE